MKIDICIPTFQGIQSLQVAAWGLARHMEHPEDANIILYVQEPRDFEDAVKAFTDEGFPCRIACTLTDLGDKGREGTVAAVHWMDALFRATTTPWIIMTEQDFFPLVKVDTFLRKLEAEKYIVGAPLDTMFCDHPNARYKNMYGHYLRLCGNPGFFHSSFMVMNRQWFADKSREPFTMPKDYKWWGQGVFGGEHYYGIRIQPGLANHDIAFFRQQHSPYGYSQDIIWNERRLGVHMSFSTGKREGMPPICEWDWRTTEAQRFFKDYKKGKLDEK